MQLPDLEIRPRSNWEALDLGTRLAQRHLTSLMLAWAALTLPIFALLTLVLWRYPSAALLLFWWLKPLYERLPLYFLSRAVFGETPGIGQCLRALPGQLRAQWFASLTWRRLSPTRSFDLPVVQLEGLHGKARQQRLAILGQRTSGAASWLTIAGYHLEVALLLGLMALLYLLLPEPVLADWQWQDLLAQDGQWLWLEHLTNLFYALVLVVWEPIYVACGFSLYLNRRTELEGWDIELGFRRLRQRAPRAAALGLVLLGCLLLVPPEPAWAERAPKPQDERLLNQALTSAEAQKRITALLSEPPFEHREQVSAWRLASTDEPEETDDADGTDLFERLRTLREFFESLAPMTEGLLWIALFAGVLLLVWRYRQWLALFAARVPLRLPRRPPPAVLFGLAVSPESLPADVAGEAERLWEKSPRQALGLLYRATLSHLLHQRQLPVKDSHTEAEVLALLAAQDAGAVYAYTASLTEQWQNLAYGHLPLPPDTRQRLCQGYRALFSQGVPA